MQLKCNKPTNKLASLVKRDSDICTLYDWTLAHQAQNFEFAQWVYAVWWWYIYMYRWVYNMLWESNVFVECFVYCCVYVWNGHGIEISVKRTIFVCNNKIVGCKTLTRSTFVLKLFSSGCVVTSKVFSLSVVCRVCASVIYVAFDAVCRNSMESEVERGSCAPKDTIFHIELLWHCTFYLTFISGTLALSFTLMKLKRAKRSLECGGIYIYIYIICTHTLLVWLGSSCVQYIYVYLYMYKYGNERPNLYYINASACSLPCPALVCLVFY